MNNKREIKRFLLRFPLLFKIVSLVRNLLFNRETRYKKVSYGNENPDKTFYIIRIPGKVMGLLRFYFLVIDSCNYALKHNYIPVVDMVSINNQYSCLCKNGINPWNLYFYDVSDYGLDDIKNSQNIILSGWRIRNCIKDENNKEFNDFKNMTEIVDTYKNRSNNIRLCFSTQIQNMIDEYTNTNITDLTLGVFIRGTDYTATKPVGHFKQPSISDLIAKCECFIEKYGLNQIFLVTEDSKIENELRSHFEIPIIMIGDSAFKDYRYDEGKYLFESINNAEDLHQNTINYLVRCGVLSHCVYLVSSVASGSAFTCLIKNGEFKDSYFFNIGKY